MQYPVYLQLSGTENVYAIQGPDRFWECTSLGAQTLCHDVLATTWPERQRILDMVADDGPWERIDRAAFEAQWNKGNCNMESTAIPLDVLEHVELSPYTTFGIEARARWFADVTSVDGLRAALDWSRSHGVEVFVLGGGSNMLLHGDVEALVLRIQIHGC